MWHICGMPPTRRTRRQRDHAATQAPPSPRSSAAHGRGGHGQPCNRSRSPVDRLSVTVRKQAASRAGSARSGVERERHGFDHPAIAGMEHVTQPAAASRTGFRVRSSVLPVSCARARRRSGAVGQRSGSADRAPVRAARPPGRAA